MELCHSVIMIETLCTDEINARGVPSNFIDTIVDNIVAKKPKMFALKMSFEKGNKKREWNNRFAM